MADEAVIAFFDGDPEQLGPRYRAAASRYQARDGAAVPSAAYLMEHADGIAVVLLWPPEPGHEPFGTYMQSVIDELGLPFPRITHLDVADASWSEIGRAA